MCPEMPIPDTFQTPEEWFVQLERYKAVMAAANATADELNLRGRHQRSAREAFHAASFGFGYAKVRKLDGLRIRINKTENSDTDAEFVCTVEGAETLVPVQLKELPPAERNARVTADEILAKAARTYRTGTDLLLAVYLNRHQHFGTVHTPFLHVREFWFWGWSKPDHTELMLVGGSALESGNYRVAFDPRFP